MGKSKNNKRKNKKPGPTGLPSVNEMIQEDEKNGTSEDTLIQTIVDKLNLSTGVEDKECACQNLSIAVTTNPKSLNEILQSDIIRMMAPLLMDPSCVVRHSAVGALRNLSITGHVTCDSMVEQDVMTPLVALFKQYQEEKWLPKSKSKEKIDTMMEILVEATNLLWNLCENNSTALRIFNREELLSIVVNFLNRDVYGSKLAIAAAQCLHTISEDNPKAIEALSQLSLSLQVEALFQRACDESDSSFLLLRSLAAGILFNVYFGDLSKCTPFVRTGVTAVVSETLKMESSSLIVNLLEKEKLLKNDGFQDEVPRPIAEEEVSLNDLQVEVENILNAQIVALEILTNACCNDCDDEWDVDSSDASEDLCCGDEEMMDENAVKFPLNIASEIREAIISHNLLRTVLGKLNPFPDQLSTHNKGSSQLWKQVVKRLLTLQCRALLCFNNLVSCFDIEELGDCDEVYSVWCKLAQLTFKHTLLCPLNGSSVYCNTPEHVEFLEAITSALRAVIQKLAQANVPQLQQVQPSEMKLMAELAESCGESGVKINIINVMGTIGQVLGNKTSSDNQFAPLLKDTGIFFLEMACRDTVDLVVNAEALDAIFDVFGEDNLDFLCQEINLIGRLKQILPAIKHKLHIQRKTLGDHYPVIMTAKTNLIRFINYKTKTATRNGNH